MSIKQSLSDAIASLAHIRDQMPDPDRLNERLLADIRKNEGFRAKPYRDTEGKLTIGYGTLLEDGITREEAEWLLRHRLSEARSALFDGKHGTIMREMPDAASDIIEQMAYQMGVEGVYGFHRMWKALYAEDYPEAAKEMLDSLWAEQTPNRAKEMAKQMRAIKS